VPVITGVKGAAAKSIENEQQARKGIILLVGAQYLLKENT
jgi:hypothetical protein